MSAIDLCRYYLTPKRIIYPTLSSSASMPGSLKVLLNLQLLSVFDKYTRTEEWYRFTNLRCRISPCRTCGWWLMGTDKQSGNTFDVVPTHKDDPVDGTQDFQSLTERRKNCRTCGSWVLIVVRWCQCRPRIKSMQTCTGMPSGMTTLCSNPRTSCLTDQTYWSWNFNWC